MQSVTAKAKNSGYIPSLDGWRAIAILGVLVDHSVPLTVWGHSLGPLQGAGGLGVNLFFAISGFLITTRILEEERTTGRFDLKGFYIRRFFRIQPAAFVYLGVVAILLATHIIPGEWHFWVAALLLFENFAYRGVAIDPGSFFVGHFWSLAVEEHFYALLSTVLFLIKRYRFTVLAAIYGVLFIVSYHHSPYVEAHPEYARRTWWQIRYLIFPSAVAVALVRTNVRAFVEKWVRPWIVFPAWTLLLFLHRLVANHRHPDRPLHGIVTIAAELGYFVEVISTLAILSTAFHPKSWLCRLLETRVLRWIGRISYSLYLWHVMFFSRLAPEIVVHSSLLRFLSAWPVKYFAAFAAAALSYYFIEKPMMRKGHRLAPPASPGRPELAEPATGS